MVYLQPAEYAAFGLSAETSDAWVATASAMIDAWCRRPSLGAASYTERLKPGRRSGSVCLSYGPVVSVDSMSARFGACGGEGAGVYSGFADLIGGLAAVFCQPGSWVAVDVTTLDVNSATGEVTLAMNMLGVPYAEVEVTYTAGFVAVPAGVQAACAQVVRNAQATPGLNVKSTRVDTVATEYFSGSLMDAQVCAMLQPYRAERLGA